MPFNKVGRFTIQVDTGSDPATLEYRVTMPPDHELAPGGMAEEELRALAEATGGKFYREEDLHTLPASVTRKTTPFTHKDEVLLWNRWALLWVIGLLVGIDLIFAGWTWIMLAFAARSMGQTKAAPSSSL